jgi:hypothetical protein
VVKRDDPRQLVGMISLSDLLKGRIRNLEEERRREQVLRLHLLFPFPGRSAVKVKQEIHEEETETPEETASP